MKFEKIKSFLPFLWFTIVPLVSSTFLFWQIVHWTQSKNWGIWEIVLLTCISCMAMGLAIIPTTFTAISFGYIGGWNLFPALFFAYLLASIIGYVIGTYSNQDFWMNLIKSRPNGAKFISSIKGKKSALFIFSCRLSPVLPFGLSNVVMGMFKLPFKDFLIFGSLGMMPRTLIAFWVGVEADSLVKAFSQKDELPLFQFSLVALFAISTFLIIRVVKKSIT